ncbi:MAG: hypothetical protein K2J24_02070 [Muribaculaceae bacterium]|nr:hypothetical protein [Muribaculaceae bacterium]
MKTSLSLRQLPIVTAIILMLAGCSTRKALIFADRDWHISNYYGQIIDRDTTYRMTFGNVLIPDPLPIISSVDSLVKYPGMDKLISDILHTARLDSAEILFYAPNMQTMFVRPKEGVQLTRPSSLSSSLTDERPYTMWIYEDDVEVWKRTPTEMYTYTYFDRKNKRILVVDFYDYGDEPIAQIFVFQTSTKALQKAGIPVTIRKSFYRHDLNDYERYVEFWSYLVNCHRELAFSNYKIGQEQKNRKK